ncbi:MAG: energy transducer TonB [Spirochaetales bacterium]|nr:energy transducer TonB [Spirochaetales bacterium]
MNKKKQKIKNKIGAFSIMILGTFSVLFSVTVMNNFIVKQDKKDLTTPITFDVPPPVKKIEKQDPTEVKPRPVRSYERNLAPIPQLPGSLSNISVDLPDFEAENTSGLAEKLLGDLEGVAMTEDSVDTLPVPKQMQITYPERAKQREIEGKVRVSLLIGTDGKILKFKILDSNPPGIFDEAVRNAVAYWIFEPARYQNNPVQIWVTIPIPFKLH